MSLCKFCPEQKCGVLDEHFIFPVDTIPEIPFGTTFHKGSRLQCRSDMCVPNEIVEPQHFCKIVTDNALLQKARHLLSVSPDSEAVPALHLHDHTDQMHTLCRKFLSEYRLAAKIL